MSQVELVRSNTGHIETRKVTVEEWRFSAALRCLQDWGLQAPEAFVRANERDHRP